MTTAVGGIFPAAVGLQFGRKQRDSLGIGIAPLIPLDILVEALGFARRVSDDEPVLVSVRRRAPIQGEALCAPSGTRHA